MGTTGTALKKKKDDKIKDGRLGSGKGQLL